MATKIEWTQETWNWLSGCTKVSPGCANCYAEKMSRRLAAMGQRHYDNVIGSDGKWNNQTSVNELAFPKPLHWKEPRMIFVNSMSDTFHESVNFQAIAVMMEVIIRCPQHTFLVLTKRPDRMKEFFKNHFSQGFYLANKLSYLPNLWLGVTAENQEQANKRIPLLLQIPAAKRFVSIEPQLGPVNLRIPIDPLKWSGFTWRNTLSGSLYNTSTSKVSASPVEKLDWVICGSESGPNRRRFDEDWARVLRIQCETANVPFFYKQRYIGNKKFSMPLLDGKVWDQIPKR